MAVSILTSMFKNNFSVEFIKRLDEIIVNRKRFTFIASEFNNFQEMNDEYFKFFYNNFLSSGICFDDCCIVDDRMKKEQAQQMIIHADVV